MGKKKAATKKAKTTGKPKPSTKKAKVTKAKATAKTAKGKPTSKKATASKAKPPKPSKPKPSTASLPFDRKKYNKIEALLGKLGDKDLHDLWCRVYVYGDEITEKDIPAQRDDIVRELADQAYECEPTPEQMTPKGLGDLIDDSV